MSKHPWVVEAAVVEQKIRFPNERALDEYLRKLDWNYEPYKIISKEKANGYVVVIMRKRYCEYVFLGDPDPCRLSESMMQIRDQAHGISWDGDVKLVSSQKERE